MRFLLIIALFVLASCATPEQRAEDTASYINQNYGPLCEKLGYVPGSEKHRDCMVSMFNADEIRSGAVMGGGWRRRW